MIVRIGLLTVKVEPIGTYCIVTEVGGGWEGGSGGQLHHIWQIRTETSQQRMTPISCLLSSPILRNQDVLQSSEKSVQGDFSPVAEEQGEKGGEKSVIRMKCCHSGS